MCVSLTAPAQLCGETQQAIAIAAVHWPSSSQANQPVCALMNAAQMSAEQLSQPVARVDVGISLALLVASMTNPSGELGPLSEQPKTGVVHSSDVRRPQSAPAGRPETDCRLHGRVIRLCQPLNSRRRSWP